MGTTENSYIISGPSATVLIDVPDQAFATAFSKAEAALHSQGRASLTHLVLGHVSPKRVDSLVQLASTLPKGGELDPSTQRVMGVQGCFCYAPHTSVNRMKKKWCIGLAGRFAVYLWLASMNV